ncbi:MAG: hypothetical protein Q8K30_06580 [Candidatus Gracilibacteria bacterium]|nr:hypothetical protein [Candidatus Gracilibacteria bacterium]
MKKSILFIICIISIFTNTNAFFGGPSELDLYKNINEGVSVLENNMTKYEANGGLSENGILKEINDLSRTKNEKKCLDEGKDISFDEFENISLNSDISILSNYISEECKNNGNISHKTLENYSNFFKQHYQESKNTALKKSNKIYNISKIGIFSDGILENSGFDLISDIEEIDKIIFSSKTDYFGEEDVNLTDSINGLLSSLKETGNDIMSYGEQQDLYPKKYKPTLYNNNNNSISNNINETENIYMCPINNSGLSDSNVNMIFADINKIKLKQSEKYINNNDIKNLIYSNYEYDKNSVFDDGNSNSVGGYSKVRDNSIWPCESFFCINIDFITYQHNLFGGGENITIEYLLNRSNEHLSKFAATSLIPAKMSTNLFEMGLKDLNLPDIFHMAMQVSTKPVPILRLENQDKEEESEFASKNLLERYYDLNGLNYKRRNDLVLLKSIEQQKQTILATQELTVGNAGKKMDEYNDFKDNQNEKIRLVQKSIEKRVSNGVLDTFEEQYTELDKFTFSIYNYIQDLSTIINNMKDIPIDKG